MVGFAPDDGKGSPTYVRAMTDPDGTPDIDGIRRDLLNWYDAHRRDLPWRAPAGGRADAYAVWLSEIMLQQTTVATVGRYFVDFMARWPTVQALADASLDEVLVAWQGLGYYARARNLHKCAGVVARDFGGRFPDTEDALRTLPGVGPYTAAAIAAIAFDRPAVPMDGNIERVTARLFDEGTPLPSGKAMIRRHADRFVSAHRPGDFAQAMMDLGASLCAPRTPDCPACPIRRHCAGAAAGAPERLPVKAPRKVRPERRAVMFWLQNQHGAVLLRRRPESGLLGGMMELPSTPWRDGDWPDRSEIAAAAPAPTAWQPLDGEAVHVFTHFRLTMRVHCGKTEIAAGDNRIWAAPDRLDAYALPTVMKKVIELVGRSEWR